MEMADVIALNKCDGDRIQQAEQSAIELQGALQLITRTQDHWQPPVLQISALHAVGMEDMWSALDRYKRHGQLNGWIEKRRNTQQEYWFKSTIGDLLFERMSAKENWGKERDELKAQIAQGKVSPFEASRLLMDKILA
jgi:LAO/AO transport system kinase